MGRRSTNRVAFEAEIRSTAAMTFGKESHMLASSMDRSARRGLPTRVSILQWGLLAISLSNWSCGGAGPARPPSMVAVPNEQDSRRSESLPPAGASPSPTALAVAKPEPTSEARAPFGQSNVVLPVDEGWAHAVIPDEAPSRYTTWRQVGQSRVGKGYLYFLEPFNEERWLLVKSADEDSVRVYDSVTRKQLHSWPVPNLDRDESHVVLPWRGGGPPAVVVGKHDGLWLHDAASGQVLLQLAEQSVDHARWSPDGRVLATVQSAIPEQTSRFRFYERVEGGALPLLAELPVSERVDAWALSRDNRYLARVFYPSDRVTLLDLHSGRLLLDAPAQRYVGSVEFSPDGRWLVLGGEGVKWFDLKDPTHRVEYTHFYNNVGDIEFSPSGDVLVASSFDGFVRLFTYDESNDRIRLLKTLAHQKSTNVYTARFLQQGNLLVTSGGDQTVRYWAGQTSVPTSTAGRIWQSPAQWAQLDPSVGVGVNAAPAAPAGSHYVPPRLSGVPAPSRITPGHYACKISLMYKLRDCTVERDERGHTILEFSKDNLLGLRGVLYDDGPVVRFEGWLTEGGSLGCANCVQQPLHAVFRGGGSSWQGLLIYRGHFDPWVPSELPAADAVFEEAIDRFPLVLTRQ